jgi:hypothetical protein
MVRPVPLLQPALAARDAPRARRQNAVRSARGDVPRPGRTYSPSSTAGSATRRRLRTSC